MSSNNPPTSPPLNKPTTLGRSEGKSLPRIGTPDLSSQSSVEPSSQERPATSPAKQTNSPTTTCSQYSDSDFFALTQEIGRVKITTSSPMSSAKFKTTIMNRAKPEYIDSILATDPATHRPANQPVIHLPMTLTFFRTPLTSTAISQFLEDVATSRQLPKILPFPQPSSDLEESSSHQQNSPEHSTYEFMTDEDSESLTSTIVGADEASMDSVKAPSITSLVTQNDEDSLPSRHQPVEPPTKSPHQGNTLSPTQQPTNPPRKMPAEENAQTPTQQPAQQSNHLAMVLREAGVPESEQELETDELPMEPQGNFSVIANQVDLQAIRQVFSEALAESANAIMRSDSIKTSSTHVETLLLDRTRPGYKPGTTLQPIDLIACHIPIPLRPQFQEMLRTTKYLARLSSQLMPLIMDALRSIDAFQQKVPHTLVSQIYDNAVRLQSSLTHQSASWLDASPSRLLSDALTYEREAMAHEPNLELISTIAPKSLPEKETTLRLSHPNPYYLSGRNKSDSLNPSQPSTSATAPSKTPATETSFKPVKHKKKKQRKDKEKKRRKSETSEPDNQKTNPEPTDQPTNQPDRVSEKTQVTNQSCTNQPTQLLKTAFIRKPAPKPLQKICSEEIVPETDSEGEFIDHPALEACANEPDSPDVYENPVHDLAFSDTTSVAIDLTAHSPSPDKEDNQKEAYEEERATKEENQEEEDDFDVASNPPSDPPSDQASDDDDGQAQESTAASEDDQSNANKKKRKRSEEFDHITIRRCHFHKYCFYNEKMTSGQNMSSHYSKYHTTDEQNRVKGRKQFLEVSVDLEEHSRLGQLWSIQGKVARKIRSANSQNVSREKDRVKIADKTTREIRAFCRYLLTVEPRNWEKVSYPHCRKFYMQEKFMQPSEQPKKPPSNQPKKPPSDPNKPGTSAETTNQPAAKKAKSSK